MMTLLEIPFTRLRQRETENPMWIDIRELLMGGVESVVDFVFVRQMGRVLRGQRMRVMGIFQAILRQVIQRWDAVGVRFAVPQILEIKGAFNV